MAAESVRVSASSACNFSFNASQRRPKIPLSPARLLGIRPRRQSSSSSSEFFGTARLSSIFSKPSTSQSRRNFSVFAAVTDGLTLSLSLSLVVVVFITSLVVEVHFLVSFACTLLSKLLIF
jgi:hypothetical protein